MARRWTAAVVAATAMLLAACGDDGPQTAGDGKLRVIVGAAPLEFLAEEIGGEDVVVTNLTPPGTEPHDVELATDDLDRIEDADLVLYIGGDFQPAFEQAAAKRGDDAVDVLAAVGESDDPHFWLDPVAMGRAADVVAEKLGGHGRGEPVRRAIDDLHAAFEHGLGLCDRRVIVTSHDAFGRLAGRYALVTRSIAGLSPEAEPDADKLAELADFVRKEGITTVFTERLVSPRVAEALAREAGVRTAVLDPVEGSGGDYFTAMRANLAALRDALGCE